MKVVKDKILLVALVMICICGKNLSAQSFTFMKPIFQLETPVLMPILSPTSFTHSADRLSFKIDQKLSSTKKDYLENLPLFCRMEELIFKQSGLNLRINLGSNDQVRKLEGKF